MGMRKKRKSLRKAQLQHLQRNRLRSRWKSMMMTSLRTKSQRRRARLQLDKHSLKVQMRILMARTRKKRMTQETAKMMGLRSHPSRSSREMAKAKEKMAKAKRAKIRARDLVKASARMARDLVKASARMARVKVRKARAKARTKERR